MTWLSRLATNLVVIGLLTVGLLGYATVQWVGGAFLEDRYQVTVPLPETGGLFPNQEVTVLGYGVGQIRDTTLTDEGVEVLLEIRGEERVPRSAVVQVLRRSAVGEQTLNFIPVAENWQPPEGPLVASTIEPERGWEAAARGARIRPKAASFPTEVPALLRKATELFDTIEAEDLGTVVHELSLAIGDRPDLLRDLNRKTLDLNETLVDAIPTFRALIDSSEPVLAALDEHRQALAGMFPPLADVSDLLAEERPTLEGLIDSGQLALEQGDLFVRGTRENQHCLFADFGDLNAMIAEPDNLNDLSRGLRQNRFFYADGFDVITQHDPFRPEIAWQRINLLLFEPAGGRPYQPHRPTPATKPGAACESPWGIGVDAVRQADHQPPDDTAPPIDFAPVRAGGGDGTGASERPDPAAPEGTSEYPDGTSPTPADGPATSPTPTEREPVAQRPPGEEDWEPGSRPIGLLALLIPIALGGGWLLWRRR